MPRKTTAASRDLTQGGVMEGDEWVEVELPESMM